MRTNRLLASVVLLATFAAAGNARAHCLTTTVNEPDNYEPTRRGCWTEGLTLAWPSAPISVRLDARAGRGVPLEMAQRVVTESFARWSAVACEAGAKPRFTVQHLEPIVVNVDDCATEECVDVRLGANGLVIFRDEGWPHPGGDDTFGLTTVTYRPSSGRIAGAYIEINTADHNFVERSAGAPSGTVGLDYVLTHEAGHFLGIAHSDSGDAIMFSRHRFEDSGELRADDRAAACSIAPAPEPPKDKGCGCGVPATTSSSVAPISALVGLMLLSRRRRRAAPRSPR